MLTRLRRLFGILILLLALVLLAWGLRPVVYETRQVPILPDDMQLPTPLGDRAPEIGFTPGSDEPVWLSGRGGGTRV